MYNYLYNTEKNMSLFQKNNALCFSVLDYNKAPLLEV